MSHAAVRILVLLGSLAIGASLGFAQATLEPLPEPLRLPPGLRQILPLNEAASYVGDAVRIVDCPLDEDNPFGTCGNLLFGGYALYASQISGFVELRFYPPRRNIAHFEISHPGNLRGRPVKMRAPQLFEFPLKEVFVFDAFENFSEGDLNLVTGEVTNLNFSANFFNSFYEAFGKVNPRLRVGAFNFPGAYGTTYAKFDQRPDGLLDFSFHGTTFLPLGNQIEGAPVRMPLPLCGLETFCSNLQAPGSSLHPSIQYTTKTDEPSAVGDCGNACADIPFNTVQVYTVNTYYSSFLDRFNLNIPALGGPTVSRTHFQGRVEVQFGERSGDFVPVFLTLLPPEGIIGEPDDPEVVLNTFLPLSENKGLSIGLVGHDEIAVFPLQRYFPKNVALSSDPFDGARGALNLRTGKFVFDLLFPGFLTHDFIMKVLEQNDGRIPLSSFSMRGPASFEKNEKGETIFRLDGRTFRNYETFFFPSPDFVKAHAWIAGPGSFLDPALRLQAVQLEEQPERVVKIGDYQNVQAFIGDQFSIRYSIPCNPDGENGFFEYINTNPVRGGTFTMENLISVNCTNSRNSTAPPGDYDTLSFTGIGLWSKDPDELDPHVATVNVYPDSPDGVYISVQIDGGIASNVHTKPPNETLP